MIESDERRALAAAFKVTDGGYVYRAPSGWRLGRQTHFLVSPDLRERLMARSEEPYWIPVLWIAVPWIIVSFAGVAALAFLLGGSSDNPLWPIAAGLVFAIVGLVAGLAALAEHKWRRVASLLRDAPRTEERISMQEIAAAVRASGGQSRRSMFVQILSGASFLAMGIFIGGMSLGEFGRPGHLIWPQFLMGAAMAVMGFTILYVAARNLANKKD